VTQVVKGELILFIGNARLTLKNDSRRMARVVSARGATLSRWSCDTVACRMRCGA